MGSLISKGPERSLEQQPIALPLEDGMNILSDREPFGVVRRTESYAGKVQVGVLHRRTMSNLAGQFEWIGVDAANMDMDEAAYRQVDPRAKLYASQADIDDYRMNDGRAIEMHGGIVEHFIPEESSLIARFAISQRPHPFDNGENDPAPTADSH